jgi:hypothetical protein
MLPSSVLTLHTADPLGPPELRELRAVRAFATGMALIVTPAHRHRLVAHHRIDQLNATPSPWPNVGPARVAHEDPSAWTISQRAGALAFEALRASPLSAGATMSPYQQMPSIVAATPWFGHQQRANWGDAHSACTAPACRTVRAALGDLSVKPHSRLAVFGLPKPLVVHRQPLVSIVLSFVSAVSKNTEAAAMTLNNLSSVGLARARRFSSSTAVAISVGTGLAIVGAQCSADLVDLMKRRTKTHKN